MSAHIMEVVKSLSFFLITSSRSRLTFASRKVSDFSILYLVVFLTN